MPKYVALGFQSYEDFEVCNSIMNIQPGDTATSSDGMFTVLVGIERILIPHGTLMVTTDKSQKVQYSSYVNKALCLCGFTTLLYVNISY